MKQPAIYILASQRNGTLYIGVTSNLVKRIWQHRHTPVDGFAKQYAASMLVYYEPYQNMHTAITREKQLKKWNRAWKMRLIESINPNWADLYDSIIK